MLNLIEKRNRDFARRCSEIISSSPRELTVPEVVDLALMTPAPCYYVSFDTARRRITELRKGKLPVRSQRHIDKWREIERKVTSFERRGHQTDRALAIVLASALASSFFISRHRAQHIAYGHE